MDNAQPNNRGPSRIYFYAALSWIYIKTNYKKIAIITVFVIIALIVFLVTLIALTSNKSPTVSLLSTTTSTTPATPTTPTIPTTPATSTSPAIPTTPPTPPTPPTTTTTPSPPESIRIYKREEWSALPPKPDVGNLTHPAEMVIIAHSADGEICKTTNDCLTRVLSLQKSAMNNHPYLSDIPYNFLIGGDGNAYEGRGWFIKGEHTKHFNNRSIGIGFIGEYEVLEPTQEQLRTAQILIEKGVQLKAIAENYKLYGTCQLKESNSPGKALLKIITKWPHWSENKYQCQ